MGDFLGITKRKWLAFGLFSFFYSILTPTLLLLFKSIVFNIGTFGLDAVSISWMLTLFIQALVILVAADYLLGKIKERFHIGTPKRYLAMPIAVVVSSLPLPDIDFLSNLISNMGIVAFAGGIVVATLVTAGASLVLYIFSDSLAGLVFVPKPQTNKLKKQKKRKTKG